MRIIAMLANHAESAEGRLFVSGAGVENLPVPPGSSGPWLVTVALAVQLKVPWTETNRPHTLTVDLVDEDDGPAPLGAEGGGTLHLEVPFSAGRPPLAVEGSEQTVAVALNLPQLPVGRVGVFSFRLRLDDGSEERLPFRLLVPPTPQVSGGGALVA